MLVCPFFGRSTCNNFEGKEKYLQQFVLNALYVFHFETAENEKKRKEKQLKANTV